MFSFALTFYFFHAPPNNPVINYICNLLAKPANFLFQNISNADFSQSSQLPLLIFVTMFVLYSSVILIIYSVLKKIT